MYSVYNKMTETNSDEKEEEKLETTVGKSICGFLYPIYSIGMAIYYLSSTLDDIKYCPDLFSGIIRRLGRSLCYPSVYISRKL